MPRLFRVLLPSAILLLSGCGGTAPNDLGVNSNGTLSPCPQKPNCVQSYQPADTEHYVSPLTLKPNSTQSHQAIVRAIKATGGSIQADSMSAEGQHYIHAEYQSRWLKFIDDVEVLITDNAVHIRSASRIGYSDMGVNAERYQQIKTAYQQ